MEEGRREEGEGKKEEGEGKKEEGKRRRKEDASPGIEPRTFCVVGQSSTVELSP